MGTTIAMNASMRIRIAGAFALVACSLFGCHRQAAWGPTGRIDIPSQTCVDGALQRDPERSVLPAAAERFQAGCDDGDPAACSLLGLMHERGLAVKQDDRIARSLYQRACEAGNRLGCIHLKRAEITFPFLMPTQEKLLAKH